MKDRRIQNDLGIPNFYEDLKEFGITPDMSRGEISKKLNEIYKSVKTENDKRYIELAKEYLVDNKERYDGYITRRGYEFNPKKEKAKKVFKNAVIALVIAGTMSGAAFGLHLVSDNATKKSQDSNICIEYVVQEGDSLNKLHDMFYEYDYSHMVKKGIDRNTNYVYAGDIVIGRTTKEIADELVENNLGTIISIEEAVELLENNGNLSGEFKKFADGKSDMVFFVPNGKSLA